MVATKTIPVDDVKSSLRYDQETGKLWWLCRPESHFTAAGIHSAFGKSQRWNARFAGKEAGTEGADGYRQISLWNSLYRSHVLAWVIAHGAWPERSIDHINRIRNDNRLSNLRLADTWQNSANKGMTSRNRSGVIGVSFCEKNGLWSAAICFRDNRVHLGFYESTELARAAYEGACRVAFGKYSSFLSSDVLAGKEDKQ